MKFPKSLNIDNLSLFILILLLSLQLFTVCNLVIFFCCICLTLVSKRNRTVKGILIMVVYGIKTIEILKMKGVSENEINEHVKVEDVKVEDVDDVKIKDMNELVDINEIKEVDINEIGIVDMNEIGIVDMNDVTDEVDHTPTFNNEQNLIINENQSYVSKDQLLPVDQQSLPSNQSHVSKDQSFLIQDNFLNESKPLNVSSIPLFTEIKIKIKSKDLSEGKIVMNGMEIGNFETERVQIVR